ncbi:MAG: tRNA lysidine(34) synthetase [bacterium]
MKKYQQVETSIIKKYRRAIWIPFIAAIKDYRLIQPGDRIAVCISGGKDSMLMAKCVQHLQKYSDFPFEAEYLVMDPGYNQVNRQRIVDNAEALRIPIRIFETKIFDIVAKAEQSPCYLCAKMRRGHLYKQAQELGCNKIALGHHFDDVIETILMSMLYGAEIKTMMPKLHSTNFAGMELIRPLYMVKEADILAWRRYNDLQFIQCACRFTENCVLGDNGGASKRQEMKELIKKFRKTSPNIDQNIFHSIHNVNLETVIGYRRGGEQHSFLDDYDSEG